MSKNYTHVVNFYKKFDDYGWMFQSFKTTADEVKVYMSSLLRQQISGTVRNIETIKLR